MAALQDLLTPLTFAAALGSGLIAGAFFAFSSFIMRALGTLPAEKGIAAMQAINIVVINPIFLGVFTGTAILCLPVVFGAWSRWPSAQSLWLIAGALLYVVGCFGVTMVCNVPRNDALAAVDPTSPAGADLWRQYLTQWTFWNTVRTLASLAASASFITALRG